MTTVTIGRWLLVALTIVGLAFTPAVASAHGDGPATDDAPRDNGTAAEWATWMEAHMTEHMGPGAVEWMEEHMGVTVDAMARDMADGDHDRRMAGQGHGC